MRFNQLNVIGRLCADPADRESQGGKRYAGFNFAIDDGWGETKGTIFLHVRVFGKAGETVMRFCKKGSLLLLSGKIHQDRYEKDGRKVEQIVMHAFQAELPPKALNQPAQAAPPQKQKSYPDPKQTDVDTFLEADDTPF